MLDCVDALTEEVKEGMQVHEHHEHHDHDEHEDEEYDEHVWTSPVNAQLICRAISAALCQADPAHASDYTARCVDYCAELQELDADFRGVIANAKRHTLIFADRFPVRYFVEEYGLTTSPPSPAARTTPSLRRARSRFSSTASARSRRPRCCTSSFQTRRWRISSARTPAARSCCSTPAITSLPISCAAA